MTSHASNMQERRGKVRRSHVTMETGGETSGAWGALTGLVVNLFLLYLLYIGFVFLLDVFWTLPTGIFDAGLVGAGLDALRSYGLLPTLGLLTLVLSGSLAVRRLAWQINQRPSLWAEACPSCGSANLRRIPRRPLERLASGMGLRVRRYICRDCRWRGPRIVEG